MTEKPPAYNENYGANPGPQPQGAWDPATQAAWVAGPQPPPSYQDPSMYS